MLNSLILKMNKLLEKADVSKIPPIEDQFEDDEGTNLKTLFDANIDNNGKGITPDEMIKIIKKTKKRQ